MKVDEFLSHRDPGDETEHAEATDPDFQHVTSLTPSGVEVLYSWAPKRLYRVRNQDRQFLNTLNMKPYPAPVDWVEVPSVTSVLGILDKSGALSWWSQGIAAEGICEMVRRGVVGMAYDAEAEFLVTHEGDGSEIANATNLVRLLTEQKLSINHVTSKAADRGTNVHGALESWAIDQSYRANPDLYEEHERGYIVGLNKFFEDIQPIGGCGLRDVESEVMVGSLQHGFAGRYDLRLRIPNDETCLPPNVVTKTYPKREDKIETIPFGKYLIDLKTSKDCYSSHSLQLAAYEQASIECGYGSTDYRAVLRVTADGKYEFRRANAEFEDFKAVLTAYTAMQRKAWFS